MRKFTVEVRELVCVVECERTLFPVSLLEVYSFVYVTLHSIKAAAS